MFLTLLQVFHGIIYLEMVDQSPEVEVDVYNSGKLYLSAVFRVIEEGISKSLFVELSLQYNKFMVGVVYLPRGDMSAFGRMRSDMFVRYSNIVITEELTCDLFHLRKVFNLHYIIVYRLISIFSNNPFHLSITLS